MFNFIIANINPGIDQLVYYKHCLYLIIPSAVKYLIYKISNKKRGTRNKIPHHGCN